MVKILFVCHGNICRSPMAEFVMKDLVQRAGVADPWYTRDFDATWNDVYAGCKALLEQLLRKKDA